MSMRLQLIEKIENKVKEIRKAHDDDWSLEYLLEWLEELVEMYTF